MSHTKTEIDAPKHKTPEVLIRAIRQHLHNNGVGFVYAYDVNDVNEEFSKLESRNAELVEALNAMIEDCDGAECFLPPRKATIIAAINTLAKSRGAA